MYFDFFPFSYHLSRSSSDPTTIFSLIKRQLVIHNGAGSVENTSVEDAVGGNDFFSNLKNLLLDYY